MKGNIIQLITNEWEKIILNKGLKYNGNRKTDTVLNRET